MLLDVDWNVVIYNLTHIGIAFLLAMPVAFDREQEGPTAGLRTFPLVAMAACGYALVGASVLSSTDAEARVLQGIITGIGFIGGGAILKSGRRKHLEHGPYRHRRRIRPLRDRNPAVPDQLCNLAADTTPERARLGLTNSVCKPSKRQAQRDTDICILQVERLA